MSDDLKNLKEIAGFADDMAGSAMSALGCFTTIFLLVLPFAVLVVFLAVVLCDADSSYAACRAIM